MNKNNNQITGYVSWNELLKNIDNYIEEKAILLKRELKKDRRNFTVKKNSDLVHA